MRQAARILYPFLGTPSTPTTIDSPEKDIHSFGFRPLTLQDLVVVREPKRERWVLPTLFDGFLTPLVAGLVVGWHKYDFAWWCRLCEPWPKVRWDSRDECVIWIDQRGIPRSGIETMYRVRDDGSWKLMATIDWTLEPADG